MAGATSTWNPSIGALLGGSGSSRLCACRDCFCYDVCKLLACMGPLKILETCKGYYRFTRLWGIDNCELRAQRQCLEVLISLSAHNMEVERLLDWKKVTSAVKMS